MHTHGVWEEPLNVYLVSRISVLWQKLRLCKPCAHIWIIIVFIPNSTRHCPSLLMKSHPGTSITKNAYVFWGSDEHMTAAYSTLPYENSRMKRSVRQITISQSIFTEMHTLQQSSSFIQRLPLTRRSNNKKETPKKGSCDISGLGLGQHLHYLPSVVWSEISMSLEAELDLWDSLVP